jgi:DNA/RNA endonuclease YhcR with UshA esterase domain
MKLQTLVVSRVLFIIVAIAVLVLLFSVNPRPVSSGQASLKYDSMAEVAVAGVVEDVQVFPCSLSEGLGTHLALRTQSGMLVVHVAPTAFLMSHEFAIAKGDQVEIVGSKKHYRGADALIARTITRRDKTFIFRRPDGKPLWEE